jgi:rhodanese-related sulfurtransferase
MTKFRTAFSLFLFFNFLQFTACAQSTTQTAPLSPDEFEQKIAQASVQLIDVRTPEEYAAGHIGTAVNINFYHPEFKEKMDKLDKNKPVAVYCAAGGRSGKASNTLKGMGFKTIYDLAGGVGAWQAKGKNLTK